ncbi:hypothetical protein E2542_SST20426 [Spatholobus suberectus]|nr:hypothetical protein E2542_SST20426 [Spatholobus suberectus]
MMLAVEAGHPQQQKYARGEELVDNWCSEIVATKEADEDFCCALECEGAIGIIEGDHTIILGVMYGHEGSPAQLDGGSMGSGPNLKGLRVGEGENIFGDGVHPSEAIKVNGSIGVGGECEEWAQKNLVGELQGLYEVAVYWDEGGEFESQMICGGKGTNRMRERDRSTIAICDTGNYSGMGDSSSGEGNEAEKGGRTCDKAARSRGTNAKANSLKQIRKAAKRKTWSSKKNVNLLEEMNEAQLQDQGNPCWTIKCRMHNGEIRCSFIKKQG